MPVLGVLGEVCRPATVCSRRAPGGGGAAAACTGLTMLRPGLIELRRTREGAPSRVDYFFEE